MRNANLINIPIAFIIGREVNNFVRSIMANIVVAYICWVFGGPLGLHHFYLGRDKQAFVWWMSLGGFFLGWIRDLWRLPEYIYEANKDQRVRAIFQARIAKHPQPPWKIARFAGQMLIGKI
jgi:DnaJ family protein C protein 22